MALVRRPGPPDLQYPLVKVTLLYRKQATSVEPPTRVASSCNRVLVPSIREGACSNWGRRGAAQTTGPVQQLSSIVSNNSIVSISKKAPVVLLNPGHSKDNN